MLSPTDCALRQETTCKIEMHHQSDKGYYPLLFVLNSTYGTIIKVISLLFQAHSGIKI